MTITYNKQVLLKRGNTTISSTYIGPISELTYDTGLNAIRVHDGVTPGGKLMPTATQYADIIANVNPVVANISVIRSDISTLYANAATQSGLIANIIANVNPVVANISVIRSDISTLYANAATQSGLIANIVIPPAYSNVNVATYLTSGLTVNVVPFSDNVYSLGSSILRWKEVHIGPGTLYIQDQNNTGLNCALTVLDGALKIDGVNQIQVGQLKFVDNTIESNTGNVDIQIGLTQSIGNVLINRNVELATGKTFTVGGNYVVTEVESEFNPYFRDANGTFAGNATVSASYVLHGSVCHWHVRIEFAGTTEYGDSQYQITLPFDAHSGHTTASGSLHQVGGGGGSGANTMYAIIGHLDKSVSSTTLKFYYRSSTSDAVWKWNTPGGVPNPPNGDAYWAVAGDAHFDISGTYQVA